MIIRSVIQIKWLEKIKTLGRTWYKSSYGHRTMAPHPGFSLTTSTTLGNYLESVISSGPYRFPWLATSE